MSESYYVNSDGLTPATANPFVRDLLASRDVGTKAQILKGKKGWATKAAHLLDPETGELLEDTLCLAHKVAVDRGQFVKIFVAGLQATFDLSKRARSAFTALLNEYSDGSVGQDKRNDMVIFTQDMAAEHGWKVSRSTFRSAMNELCHKNFLCPVTGTSGWYWTNPTFFHRGDRLVVVNHYVTGDAAAAIPAEQGGDPDLDQMDFDGKTKRDNL